LREAGNIVRKLYKRKEREKPVDSDIEMEEATEIMNTEEEIKTMYMGDKETIEYERVGKKKE
jgi:hypothetical protein